METLIAIALALLVSTSTTKVEYAEKLEDKEIYNASRTRLNDLIHTDLSVRFNWEKQHLLGTAELTLKPYFHSTDELILDAKGFDIHSVSMNGEELLYDYDNLLLDIQLDRVYDRTEDYTIIIKYTAKPNELAVEGSSAITDAKGLYFINPLGEDKNKPMQIWTQGETEASSCWFPTIDSPNERTTQNIDITVKKNFTTLSNGLLVKSVENEDGTRTDYWQQKLGHTPYLAMMAVGEFNITYDKWEDKDVTYYLEDDYHKNARAIFGRTPDMIDYFSDLLGVDYPWEKYAQVVVRDFVSGAMENTTAVIHGEFVQMTDRELVDRHEDDIIAHELFHHWFGNLVTCESWANLPLNESFATYGEYIWREKWLGRLGADMHLENDLQNYLNESRVEQKDMIRFNYEDKEDMFDSHSYAKGGRILHMLRYHLGDDAFYSGLQKYLKDNAFNTVEIHQLRLAMEEVSGEDLNWFFNQWFLASGHPILAVDYKYNEAKKQQTVIIEQIQDQGTTPVYKLPFNIDVYEEGQTKRHAVTMTESKHEFVFDVNSKPINVIVDSEHVLLAEIFEEKPDDWWIEQMRAPLYMDMVFALRNVSEKGKENAILHALNNNNWPIQLAGIEEAESLKNKEDLSGIIEQQAKHNTNTEVRSQAILFLSELENNSEYEELFEASINKKSLYVAGAGLKGLSVLNSEKALELATSLEKDLPRVVSSLYSEYGGLDKMDYLKNQLLGSSGYKQYYASMYYSSFLKRQDLKVLLDSIPALESSLENAQSWMKRVKTYLYNDLKKAIDTKLKTEKDKELKEKGKATIDRLKIAKTMGLQ